MIMGASFKFLKNTNIDVCPDKRFLKMEFLLGPFPPDWRHRMERTKWHSSYNTQSNKNAHNV